MAKVHTGADMKSQFKQLSEADLRAYSDEASFQKGYNYYLHHAIVEPTLSESALRAFCHGSGLSPYRVMATLLPASDKSAHKVVSAGCSCPRGGFCKHLVALLLTWIHQPERFLVRSMLVGRLSEKSREELLALLEQLVQRQPDIEPLIELLMELPLATTTQERSRAIEALSVEYKHQEERQRYQKYVKKIKTIQTKDEVNPRFVASRQTVRSYWASDLSRELC